jgi:mannose-6-phosphate isomerase-like protein (cupin superfamily)
MKVTSLFACAALVSVAVAAATAQAPARGAQPPSQPLTMSKFVGHDLLAGCTKAGSFIETPEYTVTCNHRNVPGVVEIHAKETDIIYMLDGEATFVTGGKALNVKSDNPLQPRGADIQGGEVHRLVTGDVMVVPAGQPHWFKTIIHPVNYYVVKVLKP